ncbi:hypothetical protein [Intestinibacillus massiliensis]|uniref:hypothetical protein n=1 Tax=Intestinibacillus massiliensis TaxID=1871029 RepID=UPI00117ADE2C|nr:hypothetical protein [Intestinibacillus massiliensis]
MHAKRMIPLAAAAAGVLGAVLRGLNLHTGYEEGTCLPIPGNLPQILLIALSVVVAIGMLAWSRAFAPQRGVSFERTFGCRTTGYKMLAAVTGLAMGVAGAAGLFTLVTGGIQSGFSSEGKQLLDFIPLVPLWLLAILTMVSFIMTASAQSRGSINEGGAFFTIIPMFWACFDLIITFKDNGASPFVSLYAFELFAAIALVFAFYAIAGFLYSTSNPARFVFTAAVGVFFSFTCVGGYLVCWLLGGSPVELGAEAMLRYVCFAAASVYLLANLVIATRSLVKEKYTA